jgi:hypothetical protein
MLVQIDSRFKLLQKLPLRTILRKALGVGMWANLGMEEMDSCWVWRVWRQMFTQSSPKLNLRSHILKIVHCNTIDLCYAYQERQSWVSLLCIWDLKYLPYACSTVVKFSVRELSEVKRVSSHHLRLLGFKPLDCLKDYHNLRPSTFIYPSDEVVTLPFMLPELHHYLVRGLTGSTAAISLMLRMSSFSMLSSLAWGR